MIPKNKKRVPKNTLPLKDIPTDVKKYLLKIQGQIKSQKGISQYSLCLTIFKIVRDHKKVIGNATESNAR